MLTTDDGYNAVRVTGYWVFFIIVRLRIKFHFGLFNMKIIKVRVGNLSFMELLPKESHATASLISECCLPQL